MNNKNITIGGLVVVVAIFGVLAFKNPSVVQVPTELKLDTSALAGVLGNQKAPVVNVPAPVVNVAAPQVTVNVPRQTPVAAPVLGSLTGPDINSQYLCVNNSCTFYFSGSFADATSTLFKITNPFGATSTVRLARVDGVNGTTSIKIQVGTTTACTAGQSIATDSQVSGTLINVASVSSSTFFSMIGGLNSAVGSADLYANSATFPIVGVGPSECIVGFATSTSATYTTQLQGLTNIGNTFSGTYEFLWSKVR